MNCSACDDLLLRRSFDRLGVDETARLDAHLQACGECRALARGDAALLAALDALRSDIHAADPPFSFRPASLPMKSRPSRSAAIPLLRAVLAMAAVWAMAVLVWQRDAGESGLDARTRIVEQATRAAPPASIRTARLVPWIDEGLDSNAMNLRGRVRLVVPAYLPGGTTSATKTPSILIRPRKTDDVDRNQVPRRLDGDQPVGARPGNRREARV
jgi:hypothetical protein